MKVLTLAFLITDETVCLAFKKRGHGAGNWNGFGGKVEDGESIEQAACREINEESTVSVEEGSLENVATHVFSYPDEEMLVHVFFVREWKGNTVETEEMRPDWFAFDDIPYESMWEDDQYWLPLVLAGEKIKGHVVFDESGVKIKEKSFEKCELLS